MAVTRARYKRILIGDSSTLVMEDGHPRPPTDLIVRLHDGGEVKQIWGSVLQGGRR